ncbi:P1 family peptidase [Polymorphobacter sp.]|uniref:P1 family peptidase n=1 Tax=Polymorphobacter sp. TaxID=1909290 RepID=UPI003F7306D3
MRSCFTDVPGLVIGHAHDVRARTGVTVVVPDAPVVMAVDVRGGGPGTRETDALDPSTLVERVHGLVLSGGSVFGLAAADALALALSGDGIGLDVGPGLPRVPVVPGAILFDLGNGGEKGWGDHPPYAELARRAYAARGRGPEGGDMSGALGAGHGARAGSRPGGIGSVSIRSRGGFSIGALVAVNSFGEVHAGAPPAGAVPMPKLGKVDGLVRQSTCIGAIATDAPLSRAQARRVAMMAQDGLARAIRPIHTPFDGDALFVLSTAIEGAPLDAVALTEIGTLAADMVAAAVRKGAGLD